jgi:molecular chaperone GrpE (heat shock protein)
MMRQILWGLVGLFAGWLFGSRRKTEPELESETEPATEPVDLTPLAEELNDLRDVAAALRESAASLDKQLGRVGREQFKANTLDEAQQRQAQAALEQLRDLSARREADLALLREQLRADQSAQRLLVIQQLLPTLDGLDEALAAGHRLLEPSTPQEKLVSPAPLRFASEVVKKASFSQRVAFILRRGAPPATFTAEHAAWRDSVAAWLDGLGLVHERLLQVLAAEGVQPMTTRGEMFDPHRHIAVEATAAGDGTAPGTVVAEYRRGYQIGERVLRAAEVAVAKQTE